MGEINLTINGRSFGISCDDGQEQRVMDLGHYVDSHVKNVAQAGAAANDTHLLVLAALMMADEVFELRDQMAQGTGQQPQQNGAVADEALIAQTIDHLANRINIISERIQKA